MSDRLSEQELQDIRERDRYGDWRATDVERLLGHIGLLQSELSRLRSERVTLAKDSERLDFIERAGLAYAGGTRWDEDIVSVEHFDDDGEPSHEWSVIGGRCLDGIGTAIGQGPSLRDAIDKAKALSRPPEGP